MKFVNFVRYGDFEKVAEARAAHTAYADRLRAQGKLAIGGPLVDDTNRRVGLLFVYEAASKDEALSFARQDPFALANALSGYEICGWRLRGANTDLLIEASRGARQDSGEGAHRRIFVNHAQYAADKARLEAARPAHWEYDRTLKAAGKLAMAGPLSDDAGGVFVYSAACKDEAMSYLRQDPFALQGVFASCELREWLIFGLNPALLSNEVNHV